MQDGLWNLFLATGSINVYMIYKGYVSTEIRFDKVAERNVSLKNGDN